jgi:hypothetical protein
VSQPPKPGAWRVGISTRRPPCLNNTRCTVKGLVCFAWTALSRRVVRQASPPVARSVGAFFVENPPTITDADGKILQLPKLAAEGLQAPHDTPIAPGEEVKLYEWNCGLQPIGGISKNLFTIHGTGKFTLQCTRIVGPTTGNPNHPNPTLDKLATGKLELEIKSAPPAEEK